jgi:hypothetical protein
MFWAAFAARCWSATGDFGASVLDVGTGGWGEVAVAETNSKPGTEETAVVGLSVTGFCGSNAKTTGCSSGAPLFDEVTPPLTDKSMPPTGFVTVFGVRDAPEFSPSTSDVG